jgi:hypothetical protein
VEFESRLHRRIWESIKIKERERDLTHTRFLLKNKESRHRLHLSRHRLHLLCGMVNEFIESVQSNDNDELTDAPNLTTHDPNTPGGRVMCDPNTHGGRVVCDPHGARVMRDPDEPQYVNRSYPHLHRRIWESIKIKERERDLTHTRFLLNITRR